MKLPAFLLLVAASQPSFGQTRAQLAAADTLRLPLDATGQRLAYAGVVAQASTSQAELLTRGKLWFASASTAGPAGVFLQVLEPTAGVMQGTGWRQVPMLVNARYYYPRLLYTVKLAVKDNRYRYEFTNFRFENAPVAGLAAPLLPLAAEDYVRPAKPRGSSLQIARAARLALASTSQELVASLQAGMSRPAAGTEW